VEAMWRRCGGDVEAQLQSSSDEDEMASVSRTDGETEREELPTRNPKTTNLPDELNREIGAPT